MFGLGCCGRTLETAVNSFERHFVIGNYSFAAAISAATIELLVAVPANVSCPAADLKS